MLSLTLCVSWFPLWCTEWRQEGFPPRAEGKHDECCCVQSNAGGWCHFLFACLFRSFRTSLTLFEHICLIINDVTQNSDIFPVHNMDLMISSFSFETIMFAVVYFRQSLRLSHSVSPLQFHLAVGSGAQQHGDAFLRSHRRQLRPRVPLSVRRLADHRLLLQRGGGGDALLPLVPGHDGPRHGHGARPGHGSGLTVWQVPSSSRLVEMVLVFVFWFEGRRCFLLTPGRRVALRNRFMFLSAD